MTHPSLRLTQLAVHRMPGISDKYTLNTLSSGINLIYGPNAVGKTTTADAIETLLWPESNNRRSAVVSGAYQIGESNYHVNIDSGHTTLQCDGKPILKAPSEADTPELRHRYRLSLHDLLVTTDSDFAERILSESIGGYDIAEAMTRLNPREKATTSRAQTERLNSAREKLKQAKLAQSALRDELASLDKLISQQAEAKNARRKIDAISSAIRHVNAKTALDVAQQKLNNFDPLLKHLHGNERETLQKLATRRLDLEQRQSVCKNDIEIATQEERAAFPSSATIPNDVDIQTLSIQCEQLKSLDQSRHEIERRLSGARKAEEEARRILGLSISAEQLARIDANSFDNLAEFASKFETVTAQLVAAQRTLELIGSVQEPLSIDQQKKGLTLLGQWLGSSDSGAGHTNRFRFLTIAVAALGCVAWILLAREVGFTSSHGIVAVIAGLLLVIIPTVFANIWRGSNSSFIYQRDYIALGLDQPSAWTRDRVTQLADKLNSNIAAGALASEKLGWKKATEASYNNASDQYTKLENQRKSLIEVLGVAPDTDARKLSWLSDAIRVWQKTEQELQTSQTSFDTLQQQWDNLLSVIRSQLAQYDHSVDAQSAAQITAIVSDLQARLQTLKAARQSAKAAGNQLAQIDTDLATLEADRTNTLTVDSHLIDEELLDSLLSQSKDFEQATQQYQLCESEYQQSQSQLNRLRADDFIDTHTTIDKLQESLDAYTTEAEQLQSLTEQITAIQIRASQAGSHEAIALAQANVDRESEALHNLRTDNVRNVLAHKLEQYVQQVTRDQQRPAVFHRASQLFTMVTRGRYKLDLTNETDTEFRAIDTTTGMGHALNELSSSSRVQLLLAVRVAFVEGEERQIKLPLLLDEALGTSDDQRALAIIDTVIELAKDDRQIFYFTAQQDELGKWLNRTEESGVAVECIDLAKARALPLALPEDTITITPVNIGQYPAPDGDSHESYGIKINVPKLRPGVDHVGSTPLWYLIEDPQTLHRLSKLGITTWGSFETLVSAGGKDIEDVNSHLPRCTALSRALGVMHTQATIGHGKCVDRTALMESKAVTDTMIDRVAELATAYHGNANALMDAINKGEVSNFQIRRREQLRDFLTNEGYLDERAPIDIDHIRLAMIAEVTPELNIGIIDAEEVQRLWRLAYPITSLPSAQ